MTFIDRALQEPLAALVGCLVWIPVLVWVFCMVSWSIGGDLEWELALPCAAVGIALGVLTVNPPLPGLEPYLFLSVLSIVVLFPYVRAGVRRRQMVQLDIERIEGAYERLGTRPNDMAAIIRLAETVYERGMIGPAIGLLERLEPQMPLPHFAREVKMLQTWRAAAVAARAKLGAHRCLVCGGLVDAGRTHCPHCGRPYLLDYAKGRWLTGVMEPRFLIAWLVGVGAVVGIPATVEADLDRNWTVGLIVAQATVAGFILIRALMRLGRGAVA